MTEAQARALAESERYYTARRARNGEWYVWDAKSDHEVEFSESAARFWCATLSDS